jgi:hypothetical protein
MKEIPNRPKDNTNDAKNFTDNEITDYKKDIKTTEIQPPDNDTELGEDLKNSIQIEGFLPENENEKKDLLQDGLNTMLGPVDDDSDASRASFIPLTLDLPIDTILVKDITTDIIVPFTRFVSPF